MMRWGNNLPVSIQIWALWLWDELYYTLWFLKELIVLIILSPAIWALQNGREVNALVVIWGCVSLWYAFDGINYDNMPKWWFGISFYIYCVHDIFLEVMEKFFLLVFGTGTVFVLVDFVSMSIVVVLICILSAGIMKSYFPMMWGY